MESTRNPKLWPLPWTTRQLRWFGDFKRTPKPAVKKPIPTKTVAPKKVYSASVWAGSVAPMSNLVAKQKQVMNKVAANQKAYINRMFSK